LSDGRGAGAVVCAQLVQDRFSVASHPHVLMIRCAWREVHFLHRLTHSAHCSSDVDELTSARRAFD